MVARCLFLKPIKGAGGDLPAVTERYRDAVEIDHYALHETDLSPFRAILLPAHLDQRYFGSITGVVEAFLDRGGRLVFNGHVAWPMLTEFAPFEPLSSFRLDDLAIHRLADHPVFEGVAAEHLTFRRGVAGFYARGHNPMPVGAVALNGVGKDRVPCDWVYARPGGGEILMHAGNDLWMYIDSDDTTGRIVPQLIAWAERDMP
ncbi:hypothetical protein [Acuticoccus mangrovi]|uniref:Uncharacterized protein n=1 Tax=Acuticoccus mangrovi TaxID=2796142 RepID=A0A934IP25_9HYPH|nr:hypothetical protein [Acuticoccus mangrovi]MBJ3776016.1 hypothetical protein [Acuticoccus mangrovi]